MLSIKEKEDKLKESLATMLKDMNRDTVFNFVVNSVNAHRQGSGLCYDQTIQLIDEVFSNTEKKLNR